MAVRLLPAVHGHIADSVHDHEPGRWSARRQTQWFTGPLAPGFRWLAVLREEPVTSPEDHCGPAVWPTRGPRDPRAVARTPADIGVLPWTGRTVPPMAHPPSPCPATDGGPADRPDPPDLCQR